MFVVSESKQNPLSRNQSSVKITQVQSFHSKLGLKNKSWYYHPLFIHVGATLTLKVATPNEDFTCAGLRSGVEATTTYFFNLKIHLTQM
jgi:hypothetical protein